MFIKAYSMNTNEEDIANKTYPVLINSNQIYSIEPWIIGSPYSKVWFHDRICIVIDIDFKQLYNILVMK